MDKTTLVEKDLREGKDIVENLDKEGIFFPIAMWYFITKSNEWRLVLAKEGISETGAREYYKKIQKVLNKIDPRPEISVSDISLMSTESEVAKLIKTAVKTGKEISGIRFSGNVINGKLIHDAFIYRVN